KDDGETLGNDTGNEEEIEGITLGADTGNEVEGTDGAETLGTGTGNEAEVEGKTPVQVPKAIWQPLPQNASVLPQ
ncbi:MAG: hypothetical protein M1830_001608, partial [Pleopsidium flavum]